MPRFRPILWCLCLIAVLMVQHGSQDIAIGWFHIGTLWDTQGWITEISPSGTHAIIKQGDINHLVRIPSGEVLLAIENGQFRFNHDGEHLIYNEFFHEPPYVWEYHVLNLMTGDSYVFEESFRRFVSYEYFITSIQLDDDPTNIQSQIRAIASGDIIAEYTGSINEFSHDMAHFVVHEFDSTERIFKVLNLNTGEVVAEFTYPMPDHMFSFDAAFNADDSLLSLYFFPEQMLIIGTETWEELYTLSGGISFSQDGRYIAHNNHADYSEVQLIEAHTGEVLDEFLGQLYFSRDGQYWIRGEALGYDQRDWQIIDFETNEVIFQQTRFHGAPQLHGDNIVSLWDFTTQSTHVFDIRTNELIAEFAGEVNFDSPFIISNVSSLPFIQLQNWTGTETYATGRQIQMTSDNRFALVTNGLFIDIYGRYPDGVESLPSPRPPQGIARSEVGAIALYTQSDAIEPRIITESNMLNPTYFDVLGQSESSEWLYVSFLTYGQNAGMMQGWIRRDGLEEIVSWENVPTLESGDPIAELRDIAYESSH